MYSKLKSFVKGTNCLIEYFGGTIGVRQGCMVSPLLFILLLNEYITMLKKNSKAFKLKASQKYISCYMLMIWLI